VAVATVTAAADTLWVSAAECLLFPFVAHFSTDEAACGRGGKRVASHDGHKNKSQIEFLTVRLFTFFGQGPVGRPSHLGMAVTDVIKK